MWKRSPRKTLLKAAFGKHSAPSFATWQARAAKDPSIRATVVRIARDETRHAVLAHNVDTWIRRKLDSTAWARVQRARRRALEALFAHGGELHPEARAALGLPTGSEIRELARRMAGALSQQAMT